MGSAPIYGAVGPNGGGKTLWAIETLVRPKLERGGAVVSTTPVEGGWALESSRQLQGLRGCVILFDEISSCFPSRGSQSMPHEVGRILNQLRKDENVVVWTGPNWDRADKLLREVTDKVVVCRGHIDGRPRAERRDPEASAWAQHRLFRWNTYQVTHGDGFKVGDTEERPGRRKLRAQSGRWYKRPKDGSGAQSLYGTLDRVLLLDHLDETGACFRCGGHKARKKCECTAAMDWTPPPLRPWWEVQDEIRSSELVVTERTPAPPPRPSTLAA